MPRERQGSEGQLLGTALLLLDPLTERESTVLRLIAAGLSNRDIATQLHLTVGTVKCSGATSASSSQVTGADTGAPGLGRML